MEKFDCSAVKETKAPLPHPRPQFSKHKSAEQQATNIKAYKSYSSSESCVQLVVGVAETWGGGCSATSALPPGDGELAVLLLQPGASHW